MGMAAPSYAWGGHHWHHNDTAAAVGFGVGALAGAAAADAAYGPQYGYGYGPSYAAAPTYEAEGYGYGYGPRYQARYGAYAYAPRGGFNNYASGDLPCATPDGQYGQQANYAACY
ncbi:MAG TPA: hypothetical protein VE224_21040 [Pseudolabrys sp.]|nr:hypothetical protein [Pseudolabrys sp.]